MKEEVEDRIKLKSEEDEAESESSGLLHPPHSAVVFTLSVPPSGSSVASCFPSSGAAGKLGVIQ